MCARMKTSLLLSLAAHFAVLAWAAPAHRNPIPEGTFPDRFDAMMIDLDSLPPAAAAARENPPVDAREPEGKADGVVVESAREEDPGPQPGDGGAPAGRAIPNEEFARMARVREMIAKTTMYYRSAPKGFEGVLRSAMPPGALREDGSAVVSIGLRSSGELGEVDIRSDSPALLTALRRVPWEAAPLPGRYRIPCSRIKVNVSVAGERLAVGVEIL